MSTDGEKRELAEQGRDSGELLANEGMSTGKELLTLAAHSDEVTTVAFSPDSRSVLTGSRDKKLILWRAVDWDRPGSSGDRTAGN
jgi:WD40 repeat protein